MKYNYPGIDFKPFHIQFEDDWYKKGQSIIHSSHTQQLVVTRVYRNTWFRRILLRLGFKVRICQVKVKPKIYNL